MRIVLLAVLVAAPASAAADSCPAAVTGAIAKVYPRATIGACKAEREHGKDQFEVKVTTATGARLELDVAPDGAILQIEEPIALDALPGAVKKAFAAKYPRVHATGAERLTAGTVVHYEIAFAADKARKSATFAADGAFVEEE